MDINEKDFLSAVENHKGILYKLSKIYMDDPLDREDLFQEMLLQLWRSYGSFKAQSKFSTWMYRVALNTALVYIKKEKKSPKSDSLIEDIDVIDKSDHHEKEEQLTYFYRAVKQLNEIEKALIFLFLEGFSHREIAGQLGISEVNARVKLNRTKDKLQEIIKKQGYEF
ncbi:sigma-70 family RNA polymerase sigma factor [Sphingobacterium daejeonense]|uniref:RNA polymerase sigma factor n=1 Tax=Sphingobacterium daejeonense TaxID=371142 RepID=UPI0021A7B483|nr:sigma-70 family RNA polymerase sigma factor [Sphingobacterium daejeonense]MCT1532966.1 sigma-70 family RNA polymerase sigma factor [Sphingobacterium daejeonense]